MHPIIRDFINTDDRISAIVEKYYDKEQFLEKVFFDLIQLLYIENVDEQKFIELDLAIQKGHPDKNLYYYFIGFAINFTTNRGQLDRARAIHAIGSSLYSENIHPSLKSSYSLGIANLKNHEGSSEESDLLLKESIATFDKKSPRYITILGNAAIILALQGKLKELTKEDLKLLGSYEDGYRAFYYIYIKFSNILFTAEVQEGFSLFDEYKTRYVGDSINVVNGQFQLLKILSGDFDENHYVDEFSKIYVKVCHYLSIGKIEEALSTYRLMISSKMTPVAHSPIYKYLPIHIELSLKNKGKARLFLQEMEKSEGSDYMTDFLLARLQLLEMNFDGAYESFNRLIKNVNRYGAMQRLLFEMQFAKEMKITDILLLTNGIGTAEALKIPLSEKSEPAILNPSEKGTKLLIGDSQNISQLKKLIIKFSRLKEPVLITGETGTGKELVSRAIHEEGPHPKEPFLAINCGALTETLLESELFGYEAGAFTGALKERKGIFEAAGKGTVFLDEFGDISPKMQVSLLRVLESNEIRLIGGTKTRQVECKIVIATNIDLQKAVEEKKFREDLFFRLNRFDIKLAPLRERAEDIPKLIDYFLNQEKPTNIKPKIVSKKLLDSLIAYSWPGNIRELKNEMERLKILHSDKEVLDIIDFDFTHLQGSVAEISQLTEEIIKPKNILENKNVEKEITNDRILGIVNNVSKAEQRLEFLKKLFQQYKKLTRVQIMKIAEISQSTASKDLEILCKSGVIEKLTPTKSVKSHYFALIE